MGTRRGGLDKLTIGAIFVVVFAGLYGGALLWEGELLPPDTTTEAEDDLRDAVWAELNDRRAARGEEPMPQDRGARSIAQDTVDTLLAERTTTDRNGSRESAEDDEFGATPGSDGRLPNTRPYCAQVPARTEVTNLSSKPRNVTAEAVADALERADDTGILSRPPSNFRNGLGIAVRGDTVYVVYRSCELADT